MGRNGGSTQSGAVEAGVQGRDESVGDLFNEGRLGKEIDALVYGLGYSGY